MFLKQLLRKWRPSVGNKTKSKSLLGKMVIKWWLLGLYGTFPPFLLSFPKQLLCWSFQVGL